MKNKIKFNSFGLEAFKGTVCTVITRFFMTLGVSWGGGVVLVLMRRSRKVVFDVVGSKRFREMFDDGRGRMW